MEQLTKQVAALADFLWWPCGVCLILLSGILLTFLLRGLQLRGLIRALHLAFVVRRETGETGDISHFQALMTALAATVGVGNIAGVATAVFSGGPGALFWMWMSAIFGMATKYSEALLSVKYRVTAADGTMSGGPMYYLWRGLGWWWLGAVFALFGSISAFGTGNMIQSNSVAKALEGTFGVPLWVSGCSLAAITALVVLGGIRSIARVACAIVPLMIIVYLAGGLWIVARHICLVPEVFKEIVRGAFTAEAAIGGFVGMGVREAVRYGISRGVLSNESGLGSAGIAAAAAQTKTPVTQALVSMTQTFIDTIIVCNVTGFALLCTDVGGAGKTGAELTSAAFSAGLPGSSGGIIVAVSVIFFAYSTVLGWCYYGEKCMSFLLGERVAVLYRAAFCAVVFIGATQELPLVWNIADIFNALMAAPNLIGLVLLSGVILKETRRFY